MTILSILNSELKTAETLRKEKGEEVHVLFPDKSNSATTIAKDSAVTLLGHSSETTFGRPTLNDKTPAQIAEALKKIYGDNPEALQEVFILGCESGMKKQKFLGTEASFAEQLSLELSRLGFRDAKIYCVSPPPEATAMRVQIRKPAGAPYATVSAYYYENDKAEKQANAIDDKLKEINQELEKLEISNGGTENLSNWPKKDKIKWTKLMSEMKDREIKAKELEKEIVSDAKYKYNYRAMLRKTTAFHTQAAPLTDDEKNKIIETLRYAQTIKQKYKEHANKLITFIKDTKGLTTVQLTSALRAEEEIYLKETSNTKTGQNTFRNNVGNPIRQMIHVQREHSGLEKVYKGTEQLGEQTKELVRTGLKQANDLVVATADAVGQLSSAGTAKSQNTQITADRLSKIRPYYAHAVNEGLGRGKHAITVKGENFKQLTQHYKALQGDRLKSQILADVQEKLEGIESLEELKTYKQEFMDKKNNDAYRVLETAQGQFTRMFGIRTDSIAALEKMFEDKEKSLSSSSTLTKT